MRLTPRSRDRHRLGMTLATGTTTAVALSATGWVMGAAAHDYEQQQAERAAQQRAAQARAAQARAEYRAAVEAAKRPVVLRRDRPYRTHVITRYVRSAGTTGSATPAPGGTVRLPAPASGGGGGSAPPPAAAPPPPPPPPPPPAPSTGS
jgi:hypothetical protein